MSKMANRYIVLMAFDNVKSNIYGDPQKYKVATSNFTDSNINILIVCITLTNTINLNFWSHVIENVPHWLMLI